MLNLQNSHLVRAHSTRRHASRVQVSSLSLARLFIAVLATIAFTVPSIPVLADTWVVDASGSGQFTSIQAAIDTSAAADSILVRNGLYNQTTSQTIGGQPSDVVAYVDKDLTILGEDRELTRISFEGGVVGIAVVSASLTLSNVTVVGDSVSGFCFVARPPLGTPVDIGVYVDGMLDAERVSVKGGQCGANIFNGTCHPV